MRLKIFRFFIISISFLFFVAISVNVMSAAKTKGNILGKRSAKTDSEKAILGIEEIVLSYVREKQDITDFNVQNAIMQQVESSYPLNTSERPDKLKIKDIEKKADLTAKEKFPFTREELKNKYKLEADKIFTAAQINSKVTVEFQQGAYIHRVTGKYRGFTFRQDGIRIGRTVIPLIDLLPKEQIRFDNSVRLQKKKEYIQKNITSDLVAKEDFALKQMASSIDAIKKKNRGIGYIYAWHKWRTPEEVAEIIIKHYRSSVSSSSKPANP